jgi:3-oxoacyl-(acyl-carrier-protein) synthase
VSSRIAGLSWVTPLGSGVDSVWQHLLAGERAPLEKLENEQNGESYLVNRVPGDAIKNLPLHPRLRRASAISRFAAAAGLGAIADAGFAPNLERTAVVFAISNGGVIYTRRFYGEIVKSGAQSASPLLFPETVFNAPASHLAAILGICGASYTVVGDGAVGVLGLKLADDLLGSGEVDACLVVAAEEIDPLVCEAYRRWRLLRSVRTPESIRGMIVSEGAGAILLRRDGRGCEIEKIDPGSNFFRRAEATGKLRRTLERLEVETASFCIGSANGTFVDAAERDALGENVRAYSPKLALGDSIGASVLWQVIVAVQALRSRRLPRSADPVDGSRAVVLACGVNQQIGGLALCSQGEKYASAVS